MAAPSSSSISSFLRGAALLALVSFQLMFSSSAAWIHPTNHHHHRHHHYSWKSFQNFTGCRLGDQRPGLAHLKRYLHRFGYLQGGSPTGNFSDAFDHELKSALLTYQHNFHLNATGTLDAPTLSHMATPRCGVADVVNGTASSTWPGARGRTLYSFFPGRPTWPPSKRYLTYALTFTGVSLAQRALFAVAFTRWSRVSPFNFSEVDPGHSDITVGFYSRNHGDGRPFDGQGGALAHSFAPTDGRLHLDADEEWVVEGDVRKSKSEHAMDLETVVVHEIGHLLGLGHSTVVEAIMYPTIGPRTVKVDFAADDIDGIRSLYGSK